jgi:hypothetical protein
MIFLTKTFNRLSRLYFIPVIYLRYVSVIIEKRRIKKTNHTKRLGIGLKVSLTKSNQIYKQGI